MDWQLPHRFDWHGHDIAWGVIGQGPPAVLLHGTPFSSVEWRRIAPWLSRHRQVFYYDMLGYGRSAKPDADVSRGVQNGLFAALTRHWGIDAPDVVAHDYGGSTALRAHLLDGVDYRSLVLVDPIAITPQVFPIVQTVRTYGQGFADLPGALHEAALVAYISAGVKRPLRDDEMRLYLEPWLGAEGQAAFWRQVAQMDDRYSQEVEHRFDEMRCPVAVVWGAEDDWAPLAHGEELARRMPGATLDVVPDAKHLVQEDAPEAIVAVVLDVWNSTT